MALNRRIQHIRGTTAQIESINQAVKQTGISNIYVCCQKKQKTAGGFEWKYKIL